MTDLWKVTRSFQIVDFCDTKGHIFSNCSYSFSQIVFVYSDDYASHLQFSCLRSKLVDKQPYL